MTEAEKKELEELRAFKAQMEAKEAPKEPEPLEKIVLDAYNTGVPIVDIARRNRLSVEEVLVMTGNQDLLHVSIMGDQISPEEIGNQGTYNPGQVYKVPYSTN